MLFIVLPVIEWQVIVSSLLTIYHKRAEAEFAGVGEDKDFLNISRLNV